MFEIVKNAKRFITRILVSQPLYKVGDNDDDNGLVGLDVL